MRINFIYFGKEALISFRKNIVMSIASVSTVTVSLLLIGIFVILAVTVQNIIQSIEKKVEIQAFLKDEATEEQVANLQQQVASFKEVREVKYISKDEALERLKEDLKDQPEMLNALQGNPLPASLEIKLNNPQEVDEVAKKIEGKQEITDLKYGQQIVGKLFAVTNVIRVIGIILVSLLLFASLVLIANTTRLALFARRKEIAIMRLVGASNWFIRMPFLLEGVFQGLIGSAIAVIVIYFAKVTLFDKATEILPFFPVHISQSIFYQLVGMLVLFGILIGAIGSLFAIRRFLKV